MSKIVLVAAIAGLLVALSMGCLWFFIYTHGLSDTSGAHFFIRIIRYVWPTTIMMFDADHVDLGTVFLFLTSAVANAFIYALFAFSVASVWKKIFCAQSNETEGWWPGKPGN